MAIWHDLSKDIWWFIFKKLTVPQHVPFSGACTRWRSMVMEYRNIKIPTGVPGLIVPASTSADSQTRHFLAYPIGKNIDEEHDLPILSIPHKDLCCGSHQGWLVMVTNDMDVYLHNPLIGVRIDLPPVTTLPKPHPDDIPMSKWYIKKAILSASPSQQSAASDCFVVVFYGERGELAFCNVRDKSWRTIDGQNSSGYIDGVFYKDKFYIVDEYGRAHVSDLTNPQGPRVIEHHVQPPRDIPEEQKWYLVEFNGELLQIHRDIFISGDEVSGGDDYYDDDNYDDDDEEEEEEDHEEGLDNEEQVAEGGVAEDFDDFDYENESISSISNFTVQTTMFSVFRLDMSGTESRWIQVKDLDGGAIFLGMNQSFSLTSPDVVGYEGDRIYYTDDSTIGHKLLTISGKDMGVFHVGDSSFEPLLYLTNSESIKPHPLWITPMLW